MPVDISFGLDNTKQTNGEKQPMSSYVSDLKNRLEKAHELALKATRLLKRSKRHVMTKECGEITSKLETEYLLRYWLLMASISFLMNGKNTLI